MEGGVDCILSKPSRPGEALFRMRFTHSRSVSARPSYPTLADLDGNAQD